MFHWLKHPEPKKKQMDCVIIYYCCIAIYLDCRHSPDVKTASFAAFSFSDRPSAKYASKSSSNSFSLFSFSAVGFFFFASEPDASTPRLEEGVAFLERDETAGEGTLRRQGVGTIGPCTTIDGQ